MKPHASPPPNLNDGLLPQIQRLIEQSQAEALQEEKKKYEDLAEKLRVLTQAKAKVDGELTELLQKQAKEEHEANQLLMKVQSLTQEKAVLEDELDKIEAKNDEDNISREQAIFDISTKYQALQEVLRIQHNEFGINLQKQEERYEDLMRSHVKLQKNWEETTRILEMTNNHCQQREGLEAKLTESRKEVAVLTKKLESHRRHSKAMDAQRNARVRKAISLITPDDEGPKGDSEAEAGTSRTGSDSCNLDNHITQAAVASAQKDSSAMSSPEQSGEKRKRRQPSKFDNFFRSDELPLDLIMDSESTTRDTSPISVVQHEEVENSPSSADTSVPTPSRPSLPRKRPRPSQPQPAANAIPMQSDSNPDKL